jgi:hypothetical protein
MIAEQLGPLVVSYGMGVDSTAMLVGLAALGIRPDLILFADTGGEKPETYAYLPVIQAWLERVGFPPVTVIRRAPVIDGKNGSYATLEENCIVNATLPSLAFGRKGCSLKWKVEPMDAFVEAWQPAIDAWARGALVQRAIGYDAGPKDSKRCWDITTLVQLRRRTPDLGDRIVAMEKTAQPKLIKIQGLWGNGVKGARGGTPRPGSMSEFIRAIDAGQIDDAGLPRVVGELPWDGRAQHIARLERLARQTALPIERA